MGRSLRRMACVAWLAGGSLACTARAPDLCDFDRVEVPADFLGDAFGRGQVRVEPHGEAGRVGRIVLTQMEGQVDDGAGPALDLAGPATCRDGIVRVELGAGVTEDGALRVLGGEVHLVLARPGFVDRPFGTWTAELLRDDWPAPRRMSGPWTQSTSKRAVAHR